VQRTQSQLQKQQYYLNHKNNKSGPFSRFEYAIKSEQTRRKYVRRLELFFDFYQTRGATLEQKAENFLTMTKGKKRVEKTTDLILNYMSFHIDRATKKTISKSTVRNFYKPIKLFCDMNNIIFNAKVVTRGMPSGPENANDRIPTKHELLQVLKYPDRRIKPVLLTMISSGIRIGAWEWLKWKHIVPIYNKNENENGNNQILLAAKIIVYDGEPERYFSYITPEAYNALKEWMDFRAQQGETITGESWLMRDIWNTGKIMINSKESNLKKGTCGIASIPKKADANTIRQIFTRAWKIQNVRPSDNDIRRHEFKSTHCFRKYFETHAMESMKLLNVKLLMGHDTGLEKSYYKPDEKTLLEDYLKVVDLLTINEENRLKMRVEQLEIDKTDFQALAAEIAQIKKDLKRKLKGS
jgi:hypothetical protein